MILPVAAVTVLGLAARLGLSDAEKRFNSGAELMDEGRYEEAIADLDRVVEIDPTYAKTYLVLWHRPSQGEIEHLRYLPVPLRV